MWDYASRVANEDLPNPRYYNGTPTKAMHPIPLTVIHIRYVYHVQRSTVGLVLPEVDHGGHVNGSFRVCDGIRGNPNQKYALQNDDPKSTMKTRL